MDHCLSLDGHVSLRFRQGPGEVQLSSAADIPSRTLIWTLEYPLVTFLMLLIAFDILSVEAVGYSGRREDFSCRRDPMG